MKRRGSSFLFAIVELGYLGASLAFFTTASAGGVALGLWFLGGTVLLACARSASRDLHAIRLALTRPDEERGAAGAELDP